MEIPPTWGGGLQISLAPELAKSGLDLPSSLKSCRGCRLSDLITNLLLAFGLTEQQATFWVSGAEQWQDTLCLFEAGPRDKRLPTLSTESWDDDGFAQCPDLPEYGIFYFEMRIWLREPSAIIERDFKRWLRMQKRIFGPAFSRPDKQGELSNFLLRDLVVYALSQRPKWALAAVEIQLDYAGLPPLTNRRPNVRGALKRLNKETGGLNAKDARREIVRTVKERLNRIKQSKLFFPNGDRTD